MYGHRVNSANRVYGYANQYSCSPLTRWSVVAALQPKLRQFAAVPRDVRSQQKDLNPLMTPNVLSDQVTRFARDMSPITPICPTSRPEGARGKGSRGRERTKAEELIDMLALLATAGKILLCGQRHEFIG
jgi:hypothetical protein